VVEAGLRSGALNTARHARDLHRPVMAVPGPVTSEVSAGCHKIIREWGAVCVTGAHDVLELLTPLGETLAYDPPPDDTFCAASGSDSPINPGRPAAPDDPTIRDGVTEPDGLTGPANHSGPADTIGHLPLIGSPAGGRPVPPGPALLTADPAVRTARSRPDRGSLLAPGDLGTTSRAVLDAIPARGAGPAVIAVRAGRNIDAVVSSLGLLAAGGFVERCSHGWRLRRSP
jgi:predicted Rossmann fold nucleotide-binding protein DprA/Smf involved in DNA uptake